MNDIKENLRRVHEKISAAAKKCGRAPDEITLLAVSKTFPAEVISLALSAGQRQFGENRVQEAEPKIAALRSEHPVWHLVGHLQSNKARRAVELFDMIHSVDSLKLARKLSLASIELGKTLPILIQVDLANEETKFGAGPGEVFEMVSAIQGLEGLRLDGLMIIPPFFEESEETRPYFVQLRNLRDAIERKTPGCLGRGHLSMGMSHDFEVAVEEGSTIVRIGTAIFGERSRG